MFYCSSFLVLFLLLDQPERANVKIQNYYEYNVAYQTKNHRKIQTHLVDCNHSLSVLMRKIDQIQDSLVKMNLYEFKQISLCLVATLQCDLILTTALLNIIHGPFVKFPYSILLSGLGTLLSIVAWVICVIVYNNERNRESENQRHRMNHTEPLPLAELAF